MPSLGPLLVSTRYSSKLTPNIVNKGLKAFKVFTEEDFELRLYNKSDALVMVLVLRSFKAGKLIKKRGGKKCTVHLYCA